MYDVMMYEALLSELYLKHGIQIPQDGVPDFNVCCTGLTSYQYPILSDLLALIDNKLAVVPSKQTAVQKELMLDDLRRLRNVREMCIRDRHGRPCDNGQRRGSFHGFTPWRIPYCGENSPRGLCPGYHAAYC